jgi:hypothetical protein
MKRTATVTAKTDCTLIVITKQKLDEIVDSSPESKATFQAMCKDKEEWWSKQQYVEAKDKFGGEFVGEIARKDIRKVSFTVSKSTHFNVLRFP